MIYILRQMWCSSEIFCDMRSKWICFMITKTCAVLCQVDWYNSLSDIMASSNGNIFRVTGLLWGESTGHRWIPSQRPVTRSFDVFFDMRMNKRFSKQSRRRWFETPSLWHQCNVIIIRIGISIKTNFNGHFNGTWKPKLDGVLFLNVFC